MTRCWKFSIESSRCGGFDGGSSPSRGSCAASVGFSYWRCRTSTSPPRRFRRHANRVATDSEGIGVEHDVNAEVNRVQQALLSRPQLEEVARRTKLDAGVRSPSDMDDVVLELQRSLSIEVGPRREGGDDSGDNLYTITYRNGDRNKSLAVVERLLESFIGDTLGGNQAGSESAQKFLREQIQDYQNRLADTEERLAEFKKRKRRPDSGSTRGLLLALERRGRCEPKVANRSEYRDQSPC